MYVSSVYQGTTQLNQKEILGLGLSSVETRALGSVHTNLTVGNTN